ncbi:tRNA dimethylallyltransferase [Bordetella sputigena]|uniref:tRNA (adenosine(37)-N6)-dimethylallyltransferase MiaA n=1 Tax=Bordetella sputigena TaxID=1416810 RepID=UPI0039EEB7D4
MTRRTILCLTGPTAAGKSAATLALARRWPLEIVNVDSATIYRGMDIGTAKPSAEERARVPQHLLDIRDPAQAYSAAEFRADALRLIDDIHARGRIPLLAGGTMLYFKALRDGLDDLPSADPALRASLEARAAQVGWPAMHDELARLDPVTAARLKPNDSQRIQRALEVCIVSGRPMSSLFRRSAARPAPAERNGQDPAPHREPEQARDHHYVTISMEPADRAALHARIAQRFDTMLEQGLVDEVAALRARGDLHTGLPSVRCVGYRQIWAYLDGEIDLPTAREQGIAATRQLAKRQITWLRAQPDRRIVDSLAPDATLQVERICAEILAQP